MRKRSKDLDIFFNDINIFGEEVKKILYLLALNPYEEDRIFYGQGRNQLIYIKELI